MSMSSSEYNDYLHAIEAANDCEDREALSKIQKQLIANYGPRDNDVIRLLDYFRYHV